MSYVGIKDFISRAMKCGNICGNTSAAYEIYNQERETEERKIKDVEVASKDKEKVERLAVRLASSALPLLFLELERTALVGSAGSQDTVGILEVGLLPTGQAAVAATETRLSIHKAELMIGGISCHARLQLPVFQLAELARITKLTLTEIKGLPALELAMFASLEALVAITVSACPSLRAVVNSSEEVGARCKLQQLDFSENPVLASLPLPAIAAMPSVVELVCARCPNLWCPPHEVALQGGRECMEFVRAALKDGAISTQMMLILLGDGEAGKTSVFRALKSASGVAERIREDTRTVGIDTDEWHPEEVPVSGAAGGWRTLSFRVLDLAGQAVYEMTHQFFLLQRAIYLLVWRAFPLADDRRRVLTDRVRHWLDSLQIRVPGACVMLVVTHIDSVDAAALDELCGAVRETVRACLAAMRRVAPAGGRLLSVHDGGESQRVNCLLGEGVAALREQLLGFARAMPWYREPLPASFIGVRGAVERLVAGGRRHMPIAEWVQLCRRCGMDELMLAVGTRYLHETGAVRFFGDASRLDSGGGGDTTVYLSTQFMVSAMKGLLRHDLQALQDYFVATNDKLMLRRINRFNATGRLHESLVPFLWPAALAGRAYWHWVRDPERSQREAELWPEDVVREEEDLERTLGLLQRFDLVVRLEGSADELLVPGALPSALTELSPDAFALYRALPFASRRAYPALPPGAFQRIVVRVAGRADWSDLGTNRAVFYLLGNRAILAWSTEQPGPRTVLWWRASGQQLLDLITAAADHIERFFPGLIRLETDCEYDHDREPVQVLILAATNEAAAFVAEAVDAAATSAGMWRLAVDAWGPEAPKHDPGQVRVLVTCMTPELSESWKVVGRVEALLQAGVASVPVLLTGFEERHWDKPLLPQRDGQPARVLRDLSFSNEPADLRACSATRAHMIKEARKEVRMQVEREECAGIYRPQSSLVHRVIHETDQRLEQQAQDAAAAVADGLLPRVVSLLRAWRAQPPAASGSAGGSAAATAGGGDGDVVRCGCAACKHGFCRADLEALKKPEVRCQLCSTVQLVHDLLASPEVRPCPACDRKGVAAGGVFGARDCRLRMGEGLEARSYAAQCRACGEEVSLFEVFPPEVFASLHVPASGLSTPVRDLIRAIEAEADVLIWPSRLERGEEANAESLRALKLARVVLLLVTEEYAGSLECADELHAAVAAKKPLVAVLLPGLAVRDAAQSSPHEARMQSPEEVAAFWRGLTGYRRGILQRQDKVDWMLLREHAQLVTVAPTAAREAFHGAACEAAAQIASRLHRAVKLAVFSDLSRFGVRLAFLRCFIDDCGGRAPLTGLTTFEVMERFVKPRTEASQLSLCEQLLSDGGDRAAFVETARVFLSHAWKYPFLDVVEAVERRFRAGCADAEDPVIWFDVFSVSQHKSGERDFAWWNSTFLNAVGSMGEVVMVMQPWRAPVPLTRVWCIFEAYAAEATCSRFSVAMTEREAGDLVGAICEDPAALLAALRRVCCEACTATLAEDRDQIFDTVHQSVGFTQLNSMVASRMMKAVCTELGRDVARPGASGAQHARLLAALAQLHRLQGKHAKTEAIHHNFKFAADLDPDSFLRASLGFAAACARKGKGDEARNAYRSALHAAAALPLGDPARAEAASGLALACWAVEGGRTEAVSLAEEWEADCALEKCGVALRDFGLLRLAQGRTADAERLLRMGVDALREQAKEWSPLLPWHPDTLEAMAGVADAAEAQGRWEEAKSGLRALLALRERYLGLKHEDTSATRGRLVALVGGRSDTGGLGAGIGPEARRRDAGGLPPIRSDSGQGETEGVSKAMEASTSTGDVIDGLWQALPGLTVLQALQVREMRALDRGMCSGFAVNALGAPGLRRVDLSGTAFTVEGHLDIAKALLAIASGLQDLKLSNLHLDARGRDALIGSLTQLTCLHSLSFWCHIPKDYLS